jgi:hypothetical protein
MSDSSWSISESTATELIELGQAGAMTEETYTELRALLGSVKTRKQSTSRDGSENSLTSAQMRARNWERLYIKNEE